MVDVPAQWLTSAWFKLGLVIIGLALIWASLRYNIWSKRQEAVDHLAEELSWAIHNLLNRSAETAEDKTKWETDYQEWCTKISDRLGNRSFFTRADQLHFDHLGFIEAVTMTGDQRHDWLLSQLRLKFARLRDVINWSQQRTR